VSASQIEKFDCEELESLSLDDILDDMWTKMFGSEVSWVLSGDAGVRIVVALDGHEEAVHGTADIVGVENRSDEIIGIARSGEFSASSDGALFQLKLVEFSHCFCESFRLSSLLIRISEFAIFVVDRKVERLVLCRDSGPVVVFLWERFGGEIDVKSCIDDSVFVRFEDYSQCCSSRRERVSESFTTVSIHQVVSVCSVEDVDLVVGAGAAEAGSLELEVVEIGADLVTFRAVDCNSVVLVWLVLSGTIDGKGPGVGEGVHGESFEDFEVDIGVPDTSVFISSESSEGSSLGGSI